MRHGYKGTPTWNTWQAMRQRCGKKEEYKNIQICDRWNSFILFLEDMGERPEGLTLDRINNNLDYFPENCRWATPKTQARNRKNNVLVEFKGKVVSLAEFCEITNIPRERAKSWMRSGKFSSKTSGWVDATGASV